jgi:hypothetical protein
MAYGSNRLETAKRLAVFVDKILKGAKPGYLPIEQPTKVEFVVNLKTAKALGRVGDGVPRRTSHRDDNVRDMGMTYWLEQAEAEMKKLG